MKFGGHILGLVGAALFAWHLAKVFEGTHTGAGITSHHVMSLVGRVLMFADI